MSEALRIISSAEPSGIILRLVGGSAIRIHCKSLEPLFHKIGRSAKHDFDLASYGRYRAAVRHLMVRLGYNPYRSLALPGHTGKNRQIFNDPKGNRAADILFDRLVMCHEMDFLGRLELDNQTMPPADLLLQKLQIVQLNEKDIQDVALLFLEHNVSGSDIEAVNGNYMAELLSRAWGFCYTVLGNLCKVEDHVRKSPFLQDDSQRKITKGIVKLLELIDGHPKSLR